MICIDCRQAADMQWGKYEWNICPQGCVVLTCSNFEESGVEGGGGDLHTSRATHNLHI